MIYLTFLKHIHPYGYNKNNYNNSTIYRAIYYTF
nr:MAG TPA: hypothetical protein [Caudoviricetes sp.]